MKNTFVAAILALVLVTVCSAESGMKYIDAQLDASKLDEANSDLSQIEIDFCDKPGEKSVVYSISPWWTQDMCFKATNTSSKDVEVTIEFVDGTVTQDQRKNKACMQQGQNKIFWQYVTWFTASFIVPANNIMYQHAKFIVPKTANDTINGCLVYYTKSVAMGGWLNFSVLMRKAKFIDIKVRKDILTKEYVLGLLAIVLMLYYARVFFLWKQTKKLLKK